MAEPLIIDPNDRDKRLVLDPRTGSMSQVEVDSRLNDNLAGVYRQAYSAGADLAAGYQASLQVVRPGDEVLEPAPPAQQNPAAPGVQQNPAIPGVQQNPAAPEPPLKKQPPVDLLKLGSLLRDRDDIEVEVNLDNKGGKSRHRDFVNFLATDKVPDSIFGIPVVQDESQYTEKDLEFFRQNPKAAGFYDLGDEEVDEDVPQQAAKSMPSRGAYPGSLNNPGNVEKRKERRQGEVDSPHERWAKFATPQDGLREMADAIRQIAAVKLAEKGQDFTIRNFAEVYAPRVNDKGEKENDTDKYIRDLSADTGFGADEELARWDERDMAKLLRSVVKFESGAKHSAWFTDEEYAAAAAKLQEGAFE